MNVRAVICDIYRTVLEVLPGPADAEPGWRALHAEFFGEPPSSDFAAFLAACRSEVAASHAEARARGVAYPEVQWPCILGRVVPGFGALAPDRQMEFQLAEQALLRKVAIMPGAARMLRRCAEAGVPVGIASNAQAYTLHELKGVLGPEGLGMDLFAPDLALWSWQLGFSKPEPCFFQTLRARLAARGLAPGDCLMVGDRLDNDITPARTAGLQTWHLHAQGDGGWEELGKMPGLQDQAGSQRTS